MAGSDAIVSITYRLSTNCYSLYLINKLIDPIYLTLFHSRLGQTSPLDNPISKNKMQKLMPTITLFSINHYTSYARKYSIKLVGFNGSNYYKMT